jgi:hypothetical protein
MLKPIGRGVFDGEPEFCWRSPAYRWVPEYPPCRHEWPLFHQRDPIADTVDHTGKSRRTDIGAIA